MQNHFFALLNLLANLEIATKCIGKIKCKNCERNHEKIFILGNEVLCLMLIHRMPKFNSVWMTW